MPQPGFWVITFVLTASLATRTPGSAMLPWMTDEGKTKPDWFGEEIARRVADGTEYRWHGDPDSDPFSRLLNHQDVADYEKIIAFRSV